MSQLTVREKEHWKERISRKVDQAMDKLLATTDPGYMDRIREQATQMALESLGIQELEAQVAELSRQEEAVQKQRQEVYKRMVALLTGRPVENQPSSYYSQPSEIQQAVAKRRGIHESQLLENDDLDDAFWNYAVKGGAARYRLAGDFRRTDSDTVVCRDRAAPAASDAVPIRGTGDPAGS